MSSPAVAVTPKSTHAHTYIQAHWPILLEDAQSKGCRGVFTAQVLLQFTHGTGGVGSNRY